MNLVVNSHTYAVLDDSTISAIRIELTSSAELDTIRADLTEENCKSIVLGDTTYHNLIPETMTMTGAISAPVLVTFTLRVKTITEQQAEQIKELQDSILAITETLIETQTALEEAKTALAEANVSTEDSNSAAGSKESETGSTGAKTEEVTA